MTFDIDYLAGVLSSISDLLELHGGEVFKVKAYKNASLKASSISYDSLKYASVEDIAPLIGVNFEIANTIHEIINEQKSSLLNELLSKTPHGLLQLLKIRGLGPKKIKALWNKLGIIDAKQLLLACSEGKVANIKGFGVKTQDSIIESVNFFLENQNKLHYYIAYSYANNLKEDIEASFPKLLISIVGEVRRKMEVITTISILIGTSNRLQFIDFLDNNINYIHKNAESSGPFSWRGVLIENGCPIEFIICKEEDFCKNLIIHTGSEQHLNFSLSNGTTIGYCANNLEFSSEEDFYDKLGYNFIIPELREGLSENMMLKSDVLKNDNIVEYEDLAGVMHCHTTYSDGKNTIEQMARECISLGFQYIGITDHSQSAVYAGGLLKSQIVKQHKEIDYWNSILSPFKIFKGIECDIKADGTLDYEDDILAMFDFIIVSIHSGFEMSINAATDRLIKAVSNPFTTMLGHLTGRLLLKRHGYSIDHKAVIDACADNGVIIEINANPIRLDIDWRWLAYAKQKGVYISVNPDAHRLSGITDIKYGVHIARKGGLLKSNVFNTLSSYEVEKYFVNRKKSLKNG